MQPMLPAIAMLSSAAINLHFTTTSPQLHQRHRCKGYCKKTLLLKALPRTAPQ
jgi:hypothetical protein